MQQKNIIIVGAGLVGSLLSIYLSKRGHKVSIYERRGDMRKEVIPAGRSINLALSDRGIKALKEVGIADDVMQIAIPMPGRLIHNSNGNTAFQPYGKEGQAINSVSRGELNKKLMNLAEQHGVELYFNHRCDSVDWKNNEVVFEHRRPTTDDRRPTIDEHHDTEREEKVVVAFDLLFGADGAYSAARMAHMMQHDMFNYQQFYIDCGYKELSIPAGHNGACLLEKNALHIWPRKDYMLIALPNVDGSFTGTLFFPFHGNTSFDKLDTEEKVTTFFSKEFPELVELIPNLTEQFFHNPTAALVTVKCFPWVREDKFALIGDAAHAIVPFFGQGMNCGFEDCSVLHQLMDKHGDNWDKLLEDFQALRKPDADAIADMAVNNFIEMREKVADPKFLLQKKIEAHLHDKYPDKWVPAYSQVTFSPHIRYSEALQRGQKQETIMQGVMKLPDIENKWENDKNEIERLVIENVKAVH